MSKRRGVDMRFALRHSRCAIFIATERSALVRLASTLALRQGELTSCFLSFTSDGGRHRSVLVSEVVRVVFGMAYQ